MGNSVGLTADGRSDGFSINALIGHLSDSLSPTSDGLHGWDRQDRRQA